MYYWYVFHVFARPYLETKSWTNTLAIYYNKAFYSDCWMGMGKNWSNGLINNNYSKPL